MHRTLRIRAATVLLLPVALAAQKPDSATLDTSVARTRATVLEASVSTATRGTQLVGALPANVIVLQQRDIQRSAAKSVSDFLRVIPGYTNKNYQSSLVMSADQTAPALRGLGGTTASRTLVLLDGIPMNEPFSGWVHWSRIPLALVRQLEVVRGGSAGVWGDRSMGGVINLITVDPDDNHLTLNAMAGSYGTARVRAVAAVRRGPVGVLFAANYDSTNGYFNVPTALRGPVDAVVGSRDRVAFTKAIVDVSPALQVSLTGNYLNDRRHSGTALQGSKTRLADLRAAVRYLAADGSVLAAHAYAGHTGFAALQTTQSRDRTTETPVTNQFHVPADATGGQAQWSKTTFGVHQLSAGADLSTVSGAVNEELNYSQGAFTRRRRVGGHQRVFGLYVSDAVSLGERTHLFASARHDQWRDDDASRVIHDVATGAVLVDSAFAPLASSRASYTFGVHERAIRSLPLRGSVYQSFRAPTLNELYKPFVGAANTLPEANSQLRPETLTGFDAGANYSPFAGLVARLTVFRNIVHNPMQEVTIGVAGSTARVIQPCGSVPAGGTCRQRQNVDAFDTHGFEGELEAQYRYWSVHASYTWNPASITAAVTQPQLVGKAGRGTSRDQYSLSAAYENPAYVNLNVTTRFVGQRFDDDLNSLALESFYVTDVQVSRRVTSMARAVASVENLFDRPYPIARTSSGFVRVGAPRFFSAGVQYTW